MKFDGLLPQIMKGATIEEFPIGPSHFAHGPNSLGRCSNCRAGKDSILKYSIVLWLDLNGSYKQLTSVNPRILIKVPQWVHQKILQ